MITILFFNISELKSQSCRVNGGELRSIITFYKQVYPLVISLQGAQTETHLLARVKELHATALQRIVRVIATDVGGGGSGRRASGCVGASWEDKRIKMKLVSTEANKQTNKQRIRCLNDWNLTWSSGGHSHSSGELLQRGLRCFVDRNALQVWVNSND